MPLREYDCPKCGTFEVIQKMDAEPLEHHEACGAPVSRRMSLASFQLKGGGWYSDGYSSSSSGGGGGSSCGTGGCGSGACAMPPD